MNSLAAWQCGHQEMGDVRFPIKNSLAAENHLPWPAPQSLVAVWPSRAAGLSSDATSVKSPPHSKEG
jgi:hypothetical protein